MCLHKYSPGVNKGDRQFKHILVYLTHVCVIVVYVGVRAHVCAYCCTFLFSSYVRLSFFFLFLFVTSDKVVLQNVLDLFFSVYILKCARRHILDANHLPDAIFIFVAMIMVHNKYDVYDDRMLL